MPNLRGNRMSNIHPDELYEQLCENATSRKKKTLTLVHEVCRKQSESDVKDFSLGTIAGLMAEKGGLSEQALRNKTQSLTDSLSVGGLSILIQPPKSPRKRL